MHASTSYSVEGDRAVIRLNPSVYNLQMCYATAYPFMDRVWVLFDGDPSREIVITAIRKNPALDLDRFSLDFFNELLSITNYFTQFEINRDVVNAVLQRALFSASPGTAADAQAAEIDKIISEVDHAIPK